MVLFDIEINFLEYVDMECWKMEIYLNFYMNVGFLDVVKEYLLFSYIDYVFVLEFNK